MTNCYQIKDVADRSGFTAATLRYYEAIGLLPEPSRSRSGYRLYDDATLDRLAFIARAKRLGCSLDEIADLTTAWEGGTCGPVQDRLRTAVADKLASARHQIVELMTLTSELQRAASALERHRPDGACDDSCGCVSEPDGSDLMPRSVPLTAKPNALDDSGPISCSLGSASLAGRLDEWQALLAHVDDRQCIEGGIRASFDRSTPLSELIRLTAAEQDCCQFFNFAITIDVRGIALEVRAPADAVPIVESLFGPAS